MSFGNMNTRRWPVALMLAVAGVAWMVLRATQTAKADAVEEL